MTRKPTSELRNEGGAEAGLRRGFAGTTNFIRLRKVAKHNEQ
jgi:hypothetical protein